MSPGLLPIAKSYIILSYIAISYIYLYLDIYPYRPPYRHRYLPIQIISTFLSAMISAYPRFYI
ncbi:hypothetical protein I7I53_07872 [Histoplasma capsulatum var. duboisii H88]|uniref:Uncharacterized protein n=1 Tax=Ajellomyces capsulatus (strain H88) TaxID=544711 RepID=A0A8A1LI01_AJEC8|nr:hypothetical protein I7I53_07872 [Histoplasma capsulatum var. duboisii H88]